MLLMRDEKEERKKQTRSNKQTRQSNTAHPRQSLFLRCTSMYVSTPFDKTNPYILHLQYVPHNVTLPTHKCCAHRQECRDKLKSQHLVHCFLACINSTLIDPYNSPSTVGATRYWVTLQTIAPTGRSVGTSSRVNILYIVSLHAL